ncbi:hypothetical protein EMPS_03161 [Entomortierella parvispora]|uniref:Uncharacterized protein n=1 Tax=Entomortierella parvispora TaxID=205924 RepID=A0A9P3LU56_9FUNG|nr:hypothetical protein EMPS_03161 [Entomortierella parvispora]
MSLKATAKEFVPSFGIQAPSSSAAGLAPGRPVAAIGTTPATVDAVDNSTRTRSTKPVTALKGLHLEQHPQPQMQQQHRPQQQHGTLSKGEPTQKKQYPTSAGTSKHDRIPGKDATAHSKRGQRSQQQQQSHPPNPRQQQDQIGKQPSTSHEPFQSRSQQNRPSGTRKERSSEEKSFPSHDRSKSTVASTTTATGPSSTAGTTSGSGNTSTTASRRSGSASTKGAARKGSLDLTGTRQSGQNSSTTTAAASSSSPSAAASSTSSVIPGMEPTAFICLTDVIQPVRHVVKDGVSTMEQGSDAYLDWVIRSLKEHEEITLIGMDAAIPDIISLVLRAGKQGIGYQEVRTFTTQDGLGGNKSCLQFRIQRGQGYIALEKRPPRS